MVVGIYRNYLSALKHKYDESDICSTMRPTIFLKITKLLEMNIINCPMTYFNTYRLL